MQLAGPSYWLLLTLASGQAVCPIFPPLQGGNKWAFPPAHAYFLPQPAPAAAMVPGKGEASKVAALGAPGAGHAPMHGGCITNGWATHNVGG